MDKEQRKQLDELRSKLSDTPCPHCGPGTHFHEKGVTDCRINGVSQVNRLRRQIEQRARRKEKP